MCILTGAALFLASIKECKRLLGPDADMLGHLYDDSWQQGLAMIAWLGVKMHNQDSGTADSCTDGKCLPLRLGMTIAAVAPIAGQDQIPVSGQFCLGELCVHVRSAIPLPPYLSSHLLHDL